MILRQEWLFQLGPSSCRSHRDNSFDYVHGSRLVSSHDEHDVPTSPLICSMVLCRAFTNKETDKIRNLSTLYLLVALYSHLVSLIKEKMTQVLIETLV